MQGGHDEKAETDLELRPRLVLYTDPAVDNPNELVDHRLVRPLRQQRSDGVVPPVCDAKQPDSAHRCYSRMNGKRTKNDEQWASPTRAPEPKEVAVDAPSSRHAITDLAREFLRGGRHALPSDYGLLLQ